MLSLYDLAEKAYPYQKIRGERSLNEDEHRRQMATFSTYGNGSTKILEGSSLYGIASLYLFSRRGAAHLFDFSTLRKCFVTSSSWYLIGVSFGMLVKISSLESNKSGYYLNLHRRVNQNE